MEFDGIIVQKIIYSVVTLVVIISVSQVLKMIAKKTQTAQKLHRSRYFAIKKLISFISFILFFISLVIIWGLNLNEMWGAVTGVIAMVAIAFFAVWSLIGNMLAGVIIFFTSPFKINDHIEVMPDNISGKVLAINTFYTLLTDTDDNYISIPNSMLFQRYIKRIKKK